MFVVQVAVKDTLPGSLPHAQQPQRLRNLELVPVTDTATKTDEASSTLLRPESSEDAGTVTPAETPEAKVFHALRWVRS